MPPKNDNAAAQAGDETVLPQDQATGADAGAETDAKDAPGVKAAGDPTPVADEIKSDLQPEPEPESVLAADEKPRTVTAAVFDAMTEAHKTSNGEAVQALNRVHLLFGELRNALHHAAEFVEGDLKEVLTYIKASL